MSTKAPADLASLLLTLLEILKDDQARAEPIAKLEQTLTPDATVETPETIIADEAAETISIGLQIALVAQNVGQETVTTLTGFWRALSSNKSAFSGFSSADLQILLGAISVCRRRSELA